MLCFGYTKIKLTSNLSPEQYLARLAPVVQPPKPYEWAVMPKPDNERIIFEGRVTNNGFSLVRLQRQLRGVRQAPPARIEATLRQTEDGSDVNILVRPERGTIVYVLIALLLLSWFASGFYPSPNDTLYDPGTSWGIFGGAWLLIYLTWLVVPVRNEAQTIGQTLAQVVDNQPVKVMMV